MTIHDATVEVTCDGPKCRESILVDLHAAARSMYFAADSDIAPEIKAQGWTVHGIEHFCDACSPEAG